VTLRNLLRQMFQQIKEKFADKCEVIAIFPESNLFQGRIFAGNYSYFSKECVDVQEINLQNFEEKDLEVLANTMFNSSETLKEMFEIDGEDKFFCIDVDDLDEADADLNFGIVRGTRIYHTVTGQKTRRFAVMMEDSKLRFRHGEKKLTKNFVLGNLLDVP